MECEPIPTHEEISQTTKGERDNQPVLSTIAIANYHADRSAYVRHMRLVSCQAFRMPALLLCWMLVG
jgi:hypothetical protein